jgi:hypothetical protein
MLLFCCDFNICRNITNITKYYKYHIKFDVQNYYQCGLLLLETSLCSDDRIYTSDLSHLYSLIKNLGKITKCSRKSKYHFEK